ncbi:MAG: DinB family protein, partial [Acidobacteriota bacterium]
MTANSDIDRETLRQIDRLPEFSFWKRQLELLGDRDPGSVLSSTPQNLAGLLERFPHQLFRRQALKGKWTPNQILGHLADVEWIFGYRVRTILADQTPLLQGADQEKW